MYSYGELVTIVQNPLGKKGAAYKRFFEGRENVYEVFYSTQNYVHARWVNKGRVTSARHRLRIANVLPLRITQKSLEDYL